MRKVLFAILAALLSGCAGAPSTYAEIEAEAARTGDDKRLRAFEQDAERAAEYFRVQRACMVATGHTWFCVGRSLDARKERTLEEQVREYRKVRGNCGCVKHGGT